MRLDRLQRPHENVGQHCRGSTGKEPTPVRSSPPFDALPAEPRVPQGHRQQARAALHREGLGAAPEHVQVRSVFGT